MNNGTLAFLEEMLDRELLACACRHHFRELELKAVVTLLLGGTSGSEMTIFNTFKRKWKFLDKSKYQVGFEPSIVSPEAASEMLEFAKAQLLQFHPRDDYKELLEQTVTVLGGNSKPKFKAPGATHHARWMSKAIYIYLKCTCLEIS